MVFHAALTVLVVDADRADRESSCRMLNAQGLSSAMVRTLEAANIADALSTIASEPVDAVLLDTSLDELSVLDAVRQLRQAAPDSPIVITTDAAKESLGFEAVQGGAQDYVIKGVDDARVLHRAVRHAVERAVLARARDALLYREHDARLAAEEARSDAVRARTEAEAIEQRTTFLADAGAVLGSSLDARATLTAITRLAVPTLGECAIGFIVNDHGTLEPVEAVSGRQPLCERLLAAARAIATGGDVATLLERAKRRGNLVLSSAAASPEANASPTLAGAVVAAHHCMLVPLSARGHVLGVLGLIASSGKRRYETADLALVHAFAGRAAIAMDNARLYEASRRATRTRDQVLGIVSHDLRNPLSAIGMCAAALRNEATMPPAERQRLVRTIRDSIDWTQRLLADLLDIASIEAGQLSVTPRPIDPIVVISRALDLFELSAEARLIGLADDLPDTLPAINGDEQRILQVLANLMANALKFTPPSGHIMLGAVARDADVVFRVSDTGPGIAAEHQDHIFDWFWRASHERAERGTGLGLAIAKGIVEAHGGELSVDSAPGCGATFSFTIPRASQTSRRMPVPVSETASVPA